MRLHRLIGIILLIESRGVVKAKALAEALETSERTIYRDIDILCESGIPLVSTPGPIGGFSFVEGYRINMKDLHADDVINLLLSGMGIRPQEYTESALSLKNAILKLESSVPKEYLPDIEKAKNRFFFDPNPWWKDITYNDNLDLVRKALWQSNKILIKYKKNPYDISERKLMPYGLIVKASEWYLIAFCEERKAVRSFKCSRIIETTILDEEFTPPKNFNLEKYWNGSVKSFKAGVMHLNNPTYPVTISISHQKDQLLNGFDVIDEYQKDGDYIYTIDLISFSTACSVIFTSSDVVKILSPPELFNFIIDKAQNILKKNNNL